MSIIPDKFVCLSVHKPKQCQRLPRFSLAKTSGKQKCYFFESSIVLRGVSAMDALAVHRLTNREVCHVPVMSSSLTHHSLRIRHWSFSVILAVHPVSCSTKLSLSVNRWMPKHFKVTLYPFPVLYRSTALEGMSLDISFCEANVKYLLLKVALNHILKVAEIIGHQVYRLLTPVSLC